MSLVMIQPSRLSSFVFSFDRSLAPARSGAVAGLSQDDKTDINQKNLHRHVSFVTVPSLSRLPPMV